MSAREKAVENPSVLGRAWENLRGDGFALACLAFVGVLAALCFLAPLVAPYSYDAQNLALSASPPSPSHWLGTDQLGRDIFSRILYGGKISFSVGIMATLVAVAIGACYGVVSGMAGGRTDSVMMRVVDILYSMPFTIFVILLMVVFGRSLWLIFAAIGAVQWLTMARITRAMTLNVKSLQYVDAAVSLGQSKFGIVKLHVLPNIAESVLVCATLTMPSVMLLEAFLSFLGLGVQAPLPSWGSLIKDGAEYMEDAPWLLVSPAMFFVSTLYALNKIGETLSKKEN